MLHPLSSLLDLHELFVVVLPDRDADINYAKRTQHYTAVDDVDTDNDYLTDYEELFVFQTNPLLPRTNLAQGQALLDGQVHLGADHGPLGPLPRAFGCGRPMSLSSVMPRASARAFN